ncbi:hypothetical protein FXO38_00149 [Capsicum annuum]|nr:hypothetical protein FXO37_04137 [Capsicum annuum]KAF3684686.1 hypothetical protein FXO38_00149 [Capsicum annuum]
MRANSSMDSLELQLGLKHWFLRRSIYPKGTSDVGGKESVLQEDLCRFLLTRPNDKVTILFWSCGFRFLDVNPEGKVSVINFGDKWISNSNIIVGLLDPSLIAPPNCLCQLDLTNDCVQNLGSTSPGSDVILDQKLTDNKESSSPENLGNYLDVGLVQDNSASYTSPELHQQQDASNLSSFLVNLVLFD